MDKYMLEIDDVGETGSFHQRGGSNLIFVKSRYRPDLKAIIFQAILNEDNDGAPDCYAPTKPPALDPLADGTDDENAVFDAKGNNSWHWAGVVAMDPAEAQNAGVLNRLDQRLSVRDADGKFPVFQPNMRFYVSQTPTAANPGLLITDQARFWNASEVSYGAITPPLRRLGVDFGDFGLAIRVGTGVSDGFVYADLGLQDKVGEMSRHLFRALFPHVDQENHPVAFIVFPGSAYRYGGKKGSFHSNPNLAIRTRLADFSLADNFSTVIGMMASGRKYKDYVVGTDPHNVGPLGMDAAEAQRIARAMQDGWGYDPEAAQRRRSREMLDEAISLGRDQRGFNTGTFPPPHPGGKDTARF